MCPSTSLPEDILLEIFKYCVHDPSWNSSTGVVAQDDDDVSMHSADSTLSLTNQSRDDSARVTIPDDEDVCMRSAGSTPEAPTNPLQTAMTLSSVCFHWRQLMLHDNVSALWARLLDVSYFNNNLMLWLLVTEQRIGTSAPIWLRYRDKTPTKYLEAKLQDHRNQMYQWVLPLLLSCSHRITKLDLDVWHPTQLMYPERLKLPIIWASATRLHFGTMSLEEYPQLEILGYRSDDLRSDAQKDFAGLLVSIVDTGVVARNLAILRLDGVPLSANDLLNLLRLTPNLECLGVTASAWWDRGDYSRVENSPSANEPLSMLDLPRLRYFNMEGTTDFAIATVVLPRLKLSESAACEVKIAAALPVELYSFLEGRPDFLAFGSALGAILRRTLASRPPNDAEAECIITQTPFYRGTKLQWGAESSPFSVSIRADGDGYFDDDEPLPSWFIDAIFPRILAEVERNDSVRKIFKSQRSVM